jgi:hypothetical protein
MVGDIEFMDADLVVILGQVIQFNTLARVTTAGVDTPVRFCVLPGEFEAYAAIGAGDEDCFSHGLFFFCFDG